MYARESDVHRVLESYGSAPQRLRARYSEDLFHTLSWVAEFEGEEEFERLFATSPVRKLLMGKIPLRVQRVRPRRDRQGGVLPHAPAPPQLDDPNEARDMMTRHPEIRDDRGRIVMIRGAPLSTRVPYVYRFLRGYDLEADMPIQRVSMRVKKPDSALFVVRFTSSEEAERFVREKQGAPLGHTFVTLFHVK